ncbi:hypothetical protein A2631_04710 [Candidatus Daviesbacteria bacterium RIFCSPHIGHO2_01_FULL_44_29]|uniref:BioF2-like acetyltransferase domain-containing protein n=1 Tax=Candidatus Daviesbacteria bacterium RIFCSPHIGHO2_02_FULL_43_12 TaxID=1797776 RepID=A0A1F5KGG2_9BACT|nr:MAG: hypothetical protein A2631_04710 [Candidatus Daviesbacteria bacterium RIFCSPHIGHO2_01_FULL_44_29]OGE40022.1 MAG: hypothetical protein A3D25_04440 [Candidatus Daviesbacteria bacterium RIFCSPHIGHO2_02_FULL_43_12]OGE41495.1 MAG: hypothetical protein A3E86_05370 [Candidatus Daviesbacteria bacterium RIFCSPHIGHO2_12_FULL_47_45]OGE70297.1 MAG: hypothetical protein A3B55_01130 [Candidatus Daviesbacteria bacterium RIFCSPLOWO2_01_FULL_43_15]
MDLRLLEEKDQTTYDKLVTHVIQSWQWGEFRKSLGLPLLRFGIFEEGKMVTAFQMTLHKIPLTNSFVGYLPKGPRPDKELSKALQQIAQDYHCAFIKIEPNIIDDGEPFRVYPTFLPSPKPLFTKFNFVLDLSPSEDQLMANLHQKTRYNIRLAQKKGVIVEERTDDQALEIYLKLYFETTTRQGYHGHSPDYHRKVWQTMKAAGMARFLIAFYSEPGTDNRQPLTAWMLLNFKDTLYYPYGGSLPIYRELMHSNLVAWKAIELGKKLKLKQFDMWGALGPNPNPKNPWYGFHRFKQGYGGKLVEYIGTYDLVVDRSLYFAFNIIDRLTTVKIFLLKLLKKA